VSKAKSTALRIIQVGLGGFGRNWYTEVLAKQPEARVVALVDLDTKALAKFAEKAGRAESVCFGSLSGALEAVDADAVLITASLPGHVPNAITALEAGLPVLMEKPFAESIDSARGAVSAAESAGRLLMISQNYRYFPAPQRAAEIVREAKLGRLGSIHIDFRRNNISYDANRARHFALENPLLADMSIHHFDLLRFITGEEVTRVRFNTWNPPWSHFTHDAAAEGFLELASGLPVSYRGSWVSPGPVTPWAGEWRMEFEKGEVSFTSREGMTNTADRLTVRDNRGKEEELELTEVEYIDRAGSLQEFIGCLRAGTRPATTGSANIGSLAVTYAAIEAAHSGDWVEPGAG
jgi:predicted dehydrogenase